MISRLLFFQNPWVLILIIGVIIATGYCARRALECDDG